MGCKRADGDYEQEVYTCSMAHVTVFPFLVAYRAMCVYQIIALLPYSNYSSNSFYSSDDSVLTSPSIVML